MIRRADEAPPRRRPIAYAEEGVLTAPLSAVKTSSPVPADDPHHLPPRRATARSWGAEGEALPVGDARTFQVPFGPAKWDPDKRPSRRRMERWTRAFHPPRYKTGTSGRARAGTRVDPPSR